MGALLSKLALFFVKTALIKFFAFTVLYLITSSFMSYLVSHLSSVSPSALTNAVAAWSPQMWYFADLTLFTQAFPAIISAYILRFSIRRMPVIG